MPPLPPPPKSALDKYSLIITSFRMTSLCSSVAKKSSDSYHQDLDIEDHVLRPKYFDDDDDDQGRI